MVNLDEIGAKLTAGRRHGQKLSSSARAVIVGAVAAGASQSAVARAFRVDRKAVQRALQRWESSSTFEAKPRSGWPERKPRLTTQILTNTVDARISRSTIRRVLRQHRIRKWRVQKRIPLTKTVAMARYKFACLWLENLEVLNRNNSSNPTTWFFRYPSQIWDKTFVNLYGHGKGTISAMVWARIWKGGRTDLIVIERDYKPPQKGGYSLWSYHQALEQGLLPIYDIYTSISSTEWLLNHAIEVLEDWPAHSLDLNPIEHMWALLKKRMKQEHPTIWLLKKNQLDMVEFVKCLRTCWWSIDQAQIDQLINSMRKRLAAVKKARGWYTKY
ncbi:hypothetical protein C7999DRAFT_40877 [Corynascus novoguineensis]|uniref:Transposase Tc1-like domain-containing protein n=1 Tax=Corynascus novoguineensis TaxID=1126955 RepID=A0AAN7CT90_9PEZI|nr:hypothetical protein C7999DRAFT_40877 [Corynascus novoguineensis]